MKKYDQEIVCLHIQKLKQELNDVFENKIGHCFILRRIKNKRWLAFRIKNKHLLALRKIE
jgi:hypothetical protein